MKPKTSKAKAVHVSLLGGKRGQSDLATAKQYGVSIRTARRWRTTGRFPILGFDSKPMKRRIGKDGKSYAVNQRFRGYRPDSHTMASRPLVCARSFLRRAETMGQYGIDARDVALLREIADMATEMAARWATVIPEKQEAGHGR